MPPPELRSQPSETTRAVGLARTWNSVSAAPWHLPNPEAIPAFPATLTPPASSASVIPEHQSIPSLKKHSGHREVATSQNDALRVSSPPPTTRPRRDTKAPVKLEPPFSGPNSKPNNRAGHQVVVKQERDELVELSPHPTGRPRRVTKTPMRYAPPPFEPATRRRKSTKRTVVKKELIKKELKDMTMEELKHAPGIEFRTIG